MAKINRYDSPAESNYFNTFVPLPLDQITALGMKRQEDLERRQDTFAKSVDDASMIDYIPGSVDESRVKNEFLPQIQQLAEEAMSIDLSNPVEWAKYSTKIKRLSVSDDIKRIEQSAAGHRQALAIAQEQKMRGVYNPLLDDTSKLVSTWDSRNNVFNYTPESQIDKAKLFDPYYANLAKEGRFGTMNGLQGQWIGISKDKVAGVAAQYAQELASTPGGQQIVKLARATNPTLNDVDPVDILRMQMTDYGMQRHGEVFDPFPASLQGGSGGSDKVVPESPYTTMPVPGQEYSLAEQDQLKLFEKGDIKSRSVGAAKRDIAKAYDKDERSLNKPISEWKTKDFARSIFLNPVGGFKIAQAAYRELPKNVREDVSKGLQQIPEIIYNMAETQALTPHNKALLYQVAVTAGNATNRTKAIIDPDYINKVENLNAVAKEIEEKYPELSYKTVTKDDVEYEEKLSPKETLYNYVDALNAGTRSDVSVYNIQDEVSWQETNDFAARTLMNRSGEIGGPGEKRGMRPVEMTLKDLGYKDVAEVANIMSDHKDNRVKLLGYGVDGAHPGTFAISIQDNNKKGGKGRILYVNAEDVVSRNLGSAHILLNSEKLKQEVDVPWSENEFIRLRYDVTNNNGRKELMPRLELWIKDENGNEYPSLDKDGNLETVNFDEVYRASLTTLSGQPNSPIVNDRGKVLNVGFRSNGLQ